MSDRNQARETTPTSKIAPQPTQEQIARIAEQVRRDAEHQPGKYLRETEVPGGGE